MVGQRLVKGRILRKRSRQGCWSIEWLLRREKKKPFSNVYLSSSYFAMYCFYKPQSVGVLSFQEVLAATFIPSTLESFSSFLAGEFCFISCSEWTACVQVRSQRVAKGAKGTPCLFIPVFCYFKLITGVFMSRVVDHTNTGCSQCIQSGRNCNCCAKCNLFCGSIQLYI